MTVAQVTGAQVNGTGDRGTGDRAQVTVAQVTGAQVSGTGDRGTGGCPRQWQCTDPGQGHFLSWKPAARTEASNSQDTQITVVCAARIPQPYSGFYPTGGMGHSTALGLSLPLRMCGFKFFYLIVMSHLGSFLFFLELLPGSLS